MYNRRVLIFSRQDSLYATCGNLCGMAKFSVVDNQTQVCVFVTNFDTNATKDCWAVVLMDGKPYKNKLQHLNNYCFVVPGTSLENVAFLLVALQDEEVVVIGESYLGNKDINAISKAQLDKLFLLDSTPYESYVESTPNYYSTNLQVDVAKLKQQSQQNYVALQNYSSAFEKYYATCRGSNYFKSVEPELVALFDKFPPYYPLINRYKDCYFVRIDFPNTDKFFVVGVLAKDKQIKYICYALPGESSSTTDKDFTFVEKDGKGFWMLCQDASTGQITTLQSQ